MNKRANGPSVFRNFFHVACSAAHAVPSGRVRGGMVFQRQAGRRVLQVFTTFRLLNSEPSERGMFQGFWSSFPQDSGARSRLTVAIATGSVLRSRIVAKTCILWHGACRGYAPPLNSEAPPRGWRDGAWGKGAAAGYRGPARRVWDELGYSLMKAKGCSDLM